MRSKGEVERRWCEGKGRREIIGGGGVLWRRKRERDPRRKEKERIDQRKGGSGDQSREKGNLIKEKIGRRRSLGGGFSRIKMIKASWTRVLFDD